MKAKQSVGLIVLLFIFNFTMEATPSINNAFFDGEFYELTEDLTDFNKELADFNKEFVESVADINNIKGLNDFDVKVNCSPFNFHINRNRSYLDPFGNRHNVNSFWGAPWFFPLTFVFSFMTNFFFVPLIIVLILLYLNHRKNTRIEQMIQSTIFYEEQKRRKEEKKKAADKKAAEQKESLVETIENKDQELTK